MGEGKDRYTIKVVLGIRKIRNKIKKGRYNKVIHSIPIHKINGEQNTPKGSTRVIWSIIGDFVDVLKIYYSKNRKR